MALKDLYNLSLIYEEVTRSNIVKTSIKDLPTEQPYGFWLALDGQTFCVVGFFNHSNVAAYAIKERPELFKSAKLADIEGPYSVMYLNNWARIVISNSILRFELQDVSLVKNEIVKKEITRDTGYSYIVWKEIDKLPEHRRQFNFMKYLCGLYGLWGIENPKGVAVWENKS